MVFDFLFTVLDQRWTKILFGNFLICGLVAAPFYYILEINIGLYAIWSTILILIVGGIASILKKFFER